VFIPDTQTGREEGQVCIWRNEHGAASNTASETEEEGQNWLDEKGTRAKSTKSERKECLYCFVVLGGFKRMVDWCFLFFFWPVVGWFSRWM